MCHLLHKQYDCSQLNIQIAVSKTTKELLLAWDEDNAERPAVSVAKDLRMPQFAMKRITTNKCNSQYHMGE